MGLLTAAVGVGTHLLFGEFSHLLASLAGRQQQPETESEPESGSHVSVGAPEMVFRIRFSAYCPK